MYRHNLLEVSKINIIQISIPRSISFSQFSKCRNLSLSNIQCIKLNDHHMLAFILNRAYTT